MTGKKRYIIPLQISFVVIVVFSSRITAQKACENSAGNCAILSGFCELPNIKNLCRKTCNNCQCVDLLQDCWILKNQCASQNTKNLCCATCSEPVVVTPTDTTGGNGGNEECKYEESWCKSYERDCERDDYVKRNCKITCKACDSEGAKWSDWSEWVCGVTCGTGTEERTRKCLRGKCQGTTKQSRSCNRPQCTSGNEECKYEESWCKNYEDDCETDEYVKQNCKITCKVCESGGAKWSDWSDWVCGVTCGTGTEERTRKCLQGKCQGSAKQSRSCTRPACTVKPKWSIWTKWICDVTCGTGTEERTRKCVRGNCKGLAKQTRACKLADCQTGDCEDKANWCDQDEVRDLCRVDEYVKRNCMKTCNLCATAEGKWSNWSDWVCDKECGPGTETRTRTCLSGNNCNGKSKEERSCTQKICPAWDEWKEWGPCTAECDGGTQQRSRDCLQGDCNPTESTESQSCNDVPCGGESDYFEWTKYGVCSEACGGGTRQRTRVCRTGQCKEHDLEIELCNENRCPVPGCTDRNSACPENEEFCDQNNVRFWCPKTCGLCPAGEQWSSFGPCDATCGVGKQTRTKSGVQQVITCDTNKPCTDVVDKGEWLEFGPFGKCSETCGPGTWERTRVCSIPNGCNTGSAVEKQPCIIKPCPEWKQWSKWSTVCSEACGPGAFTRTRECSVVGECNGNKEETKPCFIKACVVPVWKKWGDWSKCSEDCGLGKRTRTRECTVEGKCKGKSTQDGECFVKKCVVPTWKEWKKWSDCLPSCGDGKRSRTRECSVPDACTGLDSMEEDCNDGPCPSWKNWGEWSKCSKECGLGRRTRTRECTVVGKCKGRDTNGGECFVKKCSEPKWNKWSDWGKCSKQCGDGIMERTRTCTENGKCTGGSKETKPCKLKDCETDGGYTECTNSCEGGTQKKRVCDKKGKCQYTYKACGNEECPKVQCSKNGPQFANRYGSNKCCTHGRLPIGADCGRSVLDRRVVGGVNAEAKRWPWMVTFSMNGFCGGAIISKTFILTAAHCFQEDSGESRLKDNWLAVLGILTIKDWDRQNHAHNYKIKAAYVHEDYVFPKHDIALIELEKEITWSDTIRPICLPWGEETPYDSRCYVAGWGVSNVTDALTNHLQELSILNFEPGVCLEAYSTREHLKHHTEFLSTTNGYICAGSLTDETDSCSGDSGGPLVCQRCSNCNWYIAGVVSFGPNPCAEIGVPGVYSKVQYYEDWIYGITKLKKHSKSCVSP